jgi:hypothetical protein
MLRHILRAKRDAAALQPSRAGRQVHVRRAYRHLARRLAYIKQAIEQARVGGQVTIHFPIADDEHVSLAE